MTITNLTCARCGQPFELLHLCDILHGDGYWIVGREGPARVVQAEPVREQVHGIPGESCPGPGRSAAAALPSVPYRETVTLQDLYALMIREFGDRDWLSLNLSGYRWVMDLDSYKRVRAAARAAGAVFPDDAGAEPSPEDCLFGVFIEIRDDGGEPQLEGPAAKTRSPSA